MYLTGNSAINAAKLLSQISLLQQVYVSTRRGTWVMRRNGGGGIPLDVVGQRRVVADLMTLLPTGWVNAIAESIVNKVMFLSLVK